MRRVNRAIDHILQHLDEPIRLDDIAQVACFSPFHFHRIFRALMGETLNAFVKRVRLERAVHLMAFRKQASLTEVALSCGFSSSSDFSRSFRQRYGVAPSAYDVEENRRAKRQEMVTAVAHPGHLLQTLPEGHNPDGFDPCLVDLPPRRVAYRRVHRPFEENAVCDAAAELVLWAKRHGVSEGQWLGYMWDDPDIVALDKCRYDVGVVLPAHRDPPKNASVLDFPAMRVAELDIAGPLDLELRALDWLYRTWLPRSSFAPADHPSFEAWNGLPFAHGNAHFELRVQLPIVPCTTPL